MANYIDNPWNELNPYSEGQPIYGRNQIIFKLVDAIYTNLQTILYGKSGIGKTSLLQAGCFPELRKRHFFPIIIRPGIMEKSSDYTATVIDVIRESAEQGLPEIKPSLHTVTVGNVIFTDNRLCQFLYSTKFVDDSDDIYIPILIFDQFEEFLNNKKIYASAVSFVKELYVLLDNTISIPSGFLEYSNYRLVFAIREDYLYCLEDIVDHYNLDELRFNRHRITALTDKQAQNVIERTFRSAIDNISPDDLNRITNIIVPAAKGQNQESDIRTPVLSLLGSLIYRQMAEGHGVGTINTDHELYLYYDEIMSEPHIPLEVRWFLEQKLITIDGRRDSMDYQSALLTNQINEEQIDYLVKEKKIIRIVDAGSGERRIEFSHDTICKALKPVIEMRTGFYDKGNELYYSSFDVEEKQPAMVRFLSYAADLGHLEAQQKMRNLYEEKVHGVEEDKMFKSSNSKRVRLASLLKGEDWIVSRPQVDKRDYKYDVYISYSRKDRDVALGICEDLKSIGCTVWMDIDGIQTGQLFADMIIRAIESSQVILYLASENSNKSQWVNREILYALENKKKVIPIKLDDSTYPASLGFLLGQISWVDFRRAGARKDLLRSTVYLLGKESDSIDKRSDDSISILVNGYNIELTLVEGGMFTMGATLQQGGENPDERIVHIVRLDSYYMAQIPVTQKLWEIVMGKKANESFLKRLFSNNDVSEIRDNLPVDNVSWNDCITFINCLNAITGKEFRLPTEAEWEYAAKGGIKGRNNGYKYSGGNNLNNVAWISENSGGDIHEVAQKSPNELGLYDMSGNVWEWCSDWYASYPVNQVTNPQGPEDGDKKVCRGGSWNDKGSDCRISRREARDPNTRNAYIGFRLVL